MTTRQIKKSYTLSPESDSLSDEEMKELSEWGEFALSQLVSEDA